MWAQLCLTLCDPMDCSARQALLSMGFPRQEYWSAISSSRGISEPGIESVSLVSLALRVISLPLSHW